MPSCPKDHTPLTGHAIHGRSVLHCIRCAGIWVPASEFKDIPVVLSAAMGDAATTLRCPNQCLALHTIDHRGISIDFCPECRGIWLDYREIRIFFQSVSGEHAGRAPVKNEVSGAELAVDLAAETATSPEGIEALFELISEICSG